MARKLSDPQRRLLTALAGPGRLSYSGGTVAIFAPGSHFTTCIFSTATYTSLQARGLVDPDGALTDAGRDAIYGPELGPAGRGCPTCKVSGVGFAGLIPVGWDAHSQRAIWRPCPTCQERTS